MFTTTPHAIHVHTQADTKTVPYVKFMWETMLALAIRKNLLKITVHCIDQIAFDTCTGMKNANKNVLVPTGYISGVGIGSAKHAACIKSALELSSTQEITVICDADTVVVAKGWDEYIRIAMVNHNCDMLGTTYEDLGGFSSGSGLIQAYKNAPTLTWGALRHGHSWKDLVVEPNLNHHIAINSPLLSQIYGLPEGYTVFGEAAYQIPQYLYDNKLSYEAWKQLKPSKDAVVLKGTSDYHEEYHAKGVPFVLHQRGSLRHAYRQHPTSVSFYERVDAYLEDELKAAARWSWSPFVEIE